jgi:hypothetical protein
MTTRPSCGGPFSLQPKRVYLEVGYAWGCRVPTVLLAHEVNDLKFDVKGQRCIIYTSIRHLQEMLRRELEGLRL